jgi:hypothetical protein
VGTSWLWSYGSWICNYLCNQCLSPLMLWVRISIRARCATLCDKSLSVTCDRSGFLRVPWFPPPTRASPEYLTQWPLTYDLENNNISWRSISPISKPYFVKKSSNGEFLCLNAHDYTLESKDVQVHSFGHNSRKTQWTGIWY